MSAAPVPPFEGRVPRVAWATLAAGALVSQQVLGKAVRDTLLLGAFGIEALPVAMGCSALLSGVLVVALSRTALVRAPRSVASALLVASAAILLGAWGLSGISTRAAAALSYLHAGVLAAATASAFWSVVTEGYDPYAARSALPRVMAGATAGGVLGGIGTFWAAGWVEPAGLLPAGALLNLVTLAAVRRLPRPGRPPARPPTIEGASAGPKPYVRALAALVVAGAATQAVLEYLLSSAAVSTFGRGAPLLSFFAGFQAVVGVLSLLVQVRLSRRALERLGVGAVLSASPIVLLAGVLVAWLGPPLAGAAVARGADGVLGASLHRSAWEVLFAPLPAAQRRAWKPLLDVLGDRLGMLLGAGLAGLVVSTAPGHGRTLLLVAVAALAALRIALAARLQAGYRRTLADNLRDGRLGLSSAGVLDRGTLVALSRVAELDRAALLDQVSRFRASEDRRPAAGLGLAAFDVPRVGAEGDDEDPQATSPATVDGTTLEALASLGSGDAARIRAALGAEADAPLVAAQVVRLLGDARVAREAADWLLARRPAPAGTLTDALLDPDLPPAVRRRAARVLGKLEEPRAAEGLLAALDGAPAEVRSGLAQALARASARRPLPREPLLRAAARAAEAPDGLVDAFRLLSAAYPGEPVQAAFRALSRSPEERGTALEWLDVLLPAEVKGALWPRIVRPGERSADRGRPRGERPAEDAPAGGGAGDR